MWLDAITNPQAIANLYDDPTVFDKARLHRVRLSEADPIAVVEITINAKPSRLPARWRKTINTTVVELQLVGLSNILLSSWSPQSPPRITVAKGSDGLVILSTDDESLRAVCQIVYVGRIEGYLRDESSSCYQQ